MTSQLGKTKLNRNWTEVCQLTTFVLAPSVGDAVASPLLIWASSFLLAAAEG